MQEYVVSGLCFRSEVGAHQGHFSESPRSPWCFDFGFFLFVFWTDRGLWTTPQPLPPGGCGFVSELFISGLGTVGLESYKENRGSQAALSLNPSLSYVTSLNLCKLLSGKWAL